MKTDVLVPVGAFVLSVVGVGLVLSYTRRAGMLDIPNHRSSHSVPTPRGGGIALISAVLGAGGLDLWQAGQQPWTMLWLAGAIVSLAVVGWLDDRASINVASRLAVHMACGGAVAVLVNEVAPATGLLNTVWLAWWAFWAVASINIVNFMDGIDGMVAAQGVVYGIFLFALASEPALAGRFGLTLAAACAGFLIWNWSPAKMFLGDVGSGPLGLLFVIGGALALQAAPAPLVFLPLFPLFLDAMLTMAERFRRGERLTQAHRSHLYQRLASGGYGHARVAMIYAGAAATGAIVALTVKEASRWGIVAAILAYVFSVLAGWKALNDMVRKLQRS